MDHFGIGAALRAMANLYFGTARGTGRTKSLLNSLRNGDRVVCHDERTAKDLQRRCQERLLRVECIAIPPEHPGRLIERPKSDGRTLFDHTWVEQFYMGLIQRGQADIGELQTIASCAPIPATTREDFWRGRFPDRY